MPGCPRGGGLEGSSRPPLQLDLEEGSGLTLGLSAPAEVAGLSALSCQGKKVQSEGAKLLLVSKGQNHMALQRTSECPGGGKLS